MKKVILLIVAGLFLLSGAALAVPAGKTLEFTKSSMGTVTFSGKIHADAGVKCMECHNPGTFPKMKQGTVEIKMDKIYAGEQCGLCHDGTRAFAAKTSCNRCHKR